jgi:hypothetical protein
MNSNQDNGPPAEIAGDEQPSVLNALALDGTVNVMRRFNRNTMLVATGLLGTVIFAALVLVAQEHNLLPAGVTEKVIQTNVEVLPNASPVELSEVTGLSGKGIDKISLEQAPSFDKGFTPEINHASPQACVRSWSPAQRHDSTRVTRPAVANIRHRQTTHLRFVDVKTRLIALWHQSLMRSERTRSWTQSSNLRKANRKTVSYTAQTSH